MASLCSKSWRLIAFHPPYKRSRGNGKPLGFHRISSFPLASPACRSVLRPSYRHRIDMKCEGLTRDSRAWLHSNGNKHCKRELISNAVADSGKAKDEGGSSSSGSNSQNSASIKFTNLPNVLTLGRIVAVPLLIPSFYLNGSWAPIVSTGIFVVAAVTDWLDGYLARRMGTGSAFGAFLDPVADKLLVATTLVLLCTQPLEIPWLGEAPWLLPVPAIAIIGREITMSAVREWAAAQGGDLREAVAVSNLGKWKTASQMAALTILLATKDASLNGANSLVICGVAMLYVAAGLGMWSLAAYMKGILRILLK